MIDLTKELLEELGEHKNKIGRYSCSQIWGMLNGYLKPEDYLKPEKKPLKEVLKMWSGTMKHEMVSKLLTRKGYEVEQKKEMEMPENGFVIVGKCDAINPDEVVEIKTSDKLLESKRWYEFQLKLYLTMFDRPKGKIFQPVFNDKLYLKELAVVERDDNWFNSQMLKLKDYHNKLLKICSNQ